MEHYKASDYLRRAAQMLDSAVQLTGDETTEEIDKMESRCDELASLQEKKGN